MPLFDEKISAQLGDILKNMDGAVNLAFFTQEFECRICQDTGAFLKEFSSLSEKIKLKVYDFLKDGQEAGRLGVDKIPCICVLDAGGDDTGIKFYGLPGGYEINSFISSLLEVSGKKEPIPDDLMKRIMAVDRDVHIQVFVGLTCPHCPSAVAMAHRLALENKRIRADMIDAAVFPQLAVKHSVSGVPKIVFNDREEMVGAGPLAGFLDIIERL
ncbi:MAG: thioredoxin family protein [Spirochaetes bacterium]|jgi:glutaredoxin-like protein|nr:thioredoxin family protein [Spirochaetota bacterium]